MCFEGPRSCEHAAIGFETTSVTNNVAADGPGGGLALRGTISFAAELDSVVRGNTGEAGGRSVHGRCLGFCCAGNPGCVLRDFLLLFTIVALSPA